MLRPHGPLHVLIGGTTGCDAEYDALAQLGLSTHDVESLKFQSFALTKNLYRLGLRSCPKSCAVDALGASSSLDLQATPDLRGVADIDGASLQALYKNASGARSQASPCRCGCPSLSAEIEAAEREVQESDRAGAYSNASASLCEKYLGQRVLPDASLRQKLREIATAADGLRRIGSIAHVLCEADVLIGDQLESASPMDISFWPIHPTLERLYHWKLLAWGGFHETDDDQASVDGWKDDWRASVYGADCAGHRSFDEVHLSVSTLLTATDQPTGADTVSERTLTNAELLAAFDPLRPTLPFIYAHFDWDHCTELGLDFRPHSQQV